MDQSAHDSTDHPADESAAVVMVVMMRVMMVMTRSAVGTREAGSGAQNDRKHQYRVFHLVHFYLSFLKPFGLTLGQAVSTFFSDSFFYDFLIGFFIFHRASPRPPR
jgi:hypothetical protein